MIRTLLIATRNRHKVEEIRAILGGGVACQDLNDYPLIPPLVEDAATFAGNAGRKGQQVAEWLGARGITGGVVLADDSGLEVDALGGAPGVHSARFAAREVGGEEGNASDAANNAKLLRLLAGVPPEQRGARFRCVLAVVEWLDSGAILAPRCFEGACEGRIGLAPSGGGGFGYDPLFVPEGFTQSFAELGAEGKNRLSHRAKALAGFCAWARTRGVGAGAGPAAAGG